MAVREGLPTVKRIVRASGDQRSHHIEKFEFGTSANLRESPFRVISISWFWCATSRSPLGIHVPSSPGMSENRLGAPPTTGTAQRGWSSSTPLKLPTTSSVLSGEILLRQALG